MPFRVRRVFLSSTVPPAWRIVPILSLILNVWSQRTFSTALVSLVVPMSTGVSPTGCALTLGSDPWHRFFYICMLAMGRTIENGCFLLTCLLLILPAMMSLIPPAMMTGIRIAPACSGFMPSCYSASWPSKGICSAFEHLRGLIPPERTQAALSRTNLLSTRRVTAAV